MAKRVVSVALCCIMCGAVFLSACSSSDAVQTDGNQNVEIIEANVEVSDEYKVDDTLTGKSETKKFEFTQEDFDKTLQDLTHDGDISFEYVRNDADNKPMEGPTEVEEIPVDFSMTFGELTDNGMSNYSYTIGDDVGYKTVFIGDEKDSPFKGGKKAHWIDKEKRFVTTGVHWDAHK